MEKLNRVKKCRTDMFDEKFSVGKVEEYDYGVSVNRFTRNKHKFSIITAPQLDLIGLTCAKYVEHLIKEELKSNFLIKNYNKILFVGLGNDEITADALGGKTIKKLFFSNGLKFKSQTAGICPSVQAKTGLETANIIKSVVKEFNPNLVIFIDTLASNFVERLGCSFQINNSGIAAGSGVGNANKFMNKKFLGTNCLVIGIPFMIFADNLIKNEISSELVLTPKNIDRQINNCAEILSNALNEVFFPELSKDEINNIISY